MSHESSPGHSYELSRFGARINTGDRSSPETSHVALPDLSSADWNMRRRPRGRGLSESPRGSQSPSSVRRASGSPARRDKGSPALRTGDSPVRRSQRPTSGSPSPLHRSPADLDSRREKRGIELLGLSTAGEARRGVLAVSDGDDSDALSRQEAESHSDARHASERGIPQSSSHLAKQDTSLFPSPSAALDAVPSPVSPGEPTPSQPASQDTPSPTLEQLLATVDLEAALKVVQGLSQTAAHGVHTHVPAHEAPPPPPPMSVPFDTQANYFSTFPQAMNDRAQVVTLGGRRDNEFELERHTAPSRQFEDRISKVHLTLSPATLRRAQGAARYLELRYSRVFKALEEGRRPPNPLQVARWKRTLTPAQTTALYTAARVSMAAPLRSMPLQVFPEDFVAYENGESERHAKLGTSERGGSDKGGASVRGSESTHTLHDRTNSGTVVTSATSGTAATPSDSYDSYSPRGSNYTDITPPEPHDARPTHSSHMSLSRLARLSRPHFSSLGRTTSNASAYATDSSTRTHTRAPSKPTLNSATSYTGTDQTRSRSTSASSSAINIPGTLASSRINRAGSIAGRKASSTSLVEMGRLAMTRLPCSDDSDVELGEGSEANQAGTTTGGANGGSSTAGGANGGSKTGATPAATTTAGVTTTSPGAATGSRPPHSRTTSTASVVAGPMASPKKQHTVSPFMPYHRTDRTDRTDRSDKSDAMPVLQRIRGRRPGVSAGEAYETADEVSDGAQLLKVRKEHDDKTEAEKLRTLRHYRICVRGMIDWGEGFVGDTSVARLRECNPNDARISAAKSSVLGDRNSRSGSTEISTTGMPVDEITGAGTRSNSLLKAGTPCADTPKEDALKDATGLDDEMRPTLNVLLHAFEQGPPEPVIVYRSIQKADVDLDVSYALSEEVEERVRRFSRLPRGRRVRHRVRRRIRERMRGVDLDDFSAGENTGSAVDTAGNGNTTENIETESESETSSDSSEASSVEIGVDYKSLSHVIADKYAHYPMYDDARSRVYEWLAGVAQASIPTLSTVGVTGLGLEELGTAKTQYTTSPLLPLAVSECVTQLQLHTQITRHYFSIDLRFRLPRLSGKMFAWISEQLQQKVHCIETANGELSDASPALLLYSFKMIVSAENSVIDSPRFLRLNAEGGESTATAETSSFESAGDYSEIDDDSDDMWLSRFARGDPPRRRRRGDAKGGGERAGEAKEDSGGKRMRQNDDSASHAVLPETTQTTEGDASHSATERKGRPFSAEFDRDELGFQIDSLESSKERRRSVDGPENTTSTHMSRNRTASFDRALGLLQDVPEEEGDVMDRFVSEEPRPIREDTRRKRFSMDGDDVLSADSHDSRESRASSMQVLPSRRSVEAEDRVTLGTARGHSGDVPSSRESTPEGERVAAAAQRRSRAFTLATGGAGVGAGLSGSLGGGPAAGALGAAGLGGNRLATIPENAPARKVQARVVSNPQKKLAPRRASTISPVDEPLPAHRRGTIDVRTLHLGDDSRPSSAGPSVRPAAPEHYDRGLSHRLQAVLQARTESDGPLVFHSAVTQRTELSRGTPVVPGFAEALVLLGTTVDAISRTLVDVDENVAAVNATEARVAREIDAALANIDVVSREIEHEHLHNLRALEEHLFRLHTSLATPSPLSDAFWAAISLFLTVLFWISWLVIVIGRVVWAIIAFPWRFTKWMFYIK